MKIFSTVSGKKVNFEPIKKGHIKMYVCGPTVYDLAHLGHGRSAVSFDVIRRYFLFKGYQVKYASNYTDIDDKMINRAAVENISVAELAEKIIPEYEKDYGALGIMNPDLLPRATGHIEEMIEVIGILEKKGHTYILNDGVYFDVSTFKEYGEFSRQILEELKMGARIDVKSEKKNPQDFALWKFKKENEPFWKSPWGEGRPGWHIECSAMCLKTLGERFDIHGGGLDLKFPHHECEVAQSLCALGTGSFAKYWLHNGFVNIDNEKMSKSLNNFFTLRDIFKKYKPQVVRMMYLQTHYRNPINYTDDLLEQAKAGLMRIHDFVRTVEMKMSDNHLPLNDSDIDGIETPVPTTDELKSFFVESMDDDFNTSGALSVLFDLIAKVNGLISAGKISKEGLKNAYDFVTETDKVLGIAFAEKETLDSKVEKLILERENARKNKNFKRSDEIRNRLLKDGIVLEDTSSGTVWKKI